MAYTGAYLRAYVVQIMLCGRVVRILKLCRSSKSYKNKPTPHDAIKLASLNYLTLVFLYVF